MEATDTFWTTFVNDVAGRMTAFNASRSALEQGGHGLQSPHFLSIAWWSFQPDERHPVHMTWELNRAMMEVERTFSGPGKCKEVASFALVLDQDGACGLRFGTDAVLMPAAVLDKLLDPFLNAPDTSLAGGVLSRREQ